MQGHLGKPQGGEEADAGAKGTPGPDPLLGSLQKTQGGPAHMSADLRTAPVSNGLWDLVRGPRAVGTLTYVGV